MRAEQITDFGTHRFDVVHQIMGSDRPVSGSATSGRYELQDAVEMPDTMEAIYEYRTFLLHYEMSNINSHGMGGRTPGMKYYHGVRASLLTVSLRHLSRKATSIAMKTGEKLRWDAEKETTNSAAANRLLQRQASKPWDLLA